VIHLFENLYFELLFCDRSRAGISNWVHAMEWSGQNQFVASKSVQFLVDDIEAGLLKSYGPLSFLKVS
jgi:hypothetical protein